MEFTLTGEERDLVLQILQERHREMLREIARTDRHEFKLTLQKNERLLDSVLSRLQTWRPEGEPALYG